MEMADRIRTDPFFHLLAVEGLDVLRLKTCQSDFLRIEPGTDAVEDMAFESVDGKSTVGKLHLPFFDNRFLDAFKNEDLDYLLLFSPFNHFETTNGLIELPKLVAIDVKHFKDNPDMQYINYDEKRMKSNER